MHAFLHNNAKFTKWTLRWLAGTANSEPLSVFPSGRCIDFAAATNALLLRERARRSGKGGSAIQSVIQPLGICAHTTT